MGFPPSLCRPCLALASSVLQCGLQHIKELSRKRSQALLYGNMTAARASRKVCGGGSHVCMSQNVQVVAAWISVSLA